MFYFPSLQTTFANSLFAFVIYSNIVEKVGNSVQITQPLESRALEAEHPSAIVFLVQDAKLPEVGQFQNVAAATKFFATGGNSKQPFFLPFDLLQPQQYADLFAQLAQVRIY